ncbi:MAG: lipase family alpha/beta hydrolase [Acidimicrobiales bacterium]
MARHGTGDVIVLVPGILGSVLERDGDEVWGPTPGAVWKAIRTLGRSVKDLELTDDPIDVDVLDDGVVATRLVPDVHLIPGVWGIDGYSSIHRMILDNFELKPGHYVEFPYDWRRDVRVAARQLGERVAPLLAADPAAKLVVVGHSLGGLVARYYLECLDGWRHTRRLVTYGTPYRGSLNALNFIANGFVKKVGPLTIADLSRLLRSCTSVYQLLPVYQCVHLESGDIVRPAESASIPFLDMARAKAALEDLHRAIEQGVANHAPLPYDIHPVVGITQATDQSARLAGGRLSLRQTRRGSDGIDKDESGDGTVPRVSATPIELEKPPSVFASQKHASLQNAEHVQIQLLGVMTEIDELVRVRDVREGLALSMDDVFVDGEPIGITVEVATPRLELVVTVTDPSNGRKGSPMPLVEGDDGLYTIELPPRPPGDYRVTVAGLNDSRSLVQPVAELVMVTPADPDSEP